jgi:hypothetical protein
MIDFADKPDCTMQELHDISAALNLSEESLGEIIAAVAAHAAAAPSSPIPPAWQAVRACWGVGALDAARSLSAPLLSSKADTVETLQHSGFSPNLAWLLHLGVVRPLRWRHAPDVLTWILDFGKLRRDVDGEMALLCRHGLHLVMTSIAGLWDATSGDGALALKGWPLSRRTRRCIAGTGFSLTEAEDYCRDLLARQQVCRGWRNTPRIFRLR